jgi:hypothetical protein
MLHLSFCCHLVDLADFTLSTWYISTCRIVRILLLKDLKGAIEEFYWVSFAGDAMYEQVIRRHRDASVSGH